MTEDQLNKAGTDFIRCKKEPNSSESDLNDLLCADCGDPFNPDKSIDSECCDKCRLLMRPCLECGASDEYQAESKCLCSGDKDSCHGSEHLFG